MFSKEPVVQMSRARRRGPDSYYGVTIYPFTVTYKYLFLCHFFVLEVILK